MSDPIRTISPYDNAAQVCVDPSLTSEALHGLAALFNDGAMSTYAGNFETGLPINSSLGFGAFFVPNINRHLSPIDARVTGLIAALNDTAVAKGVILPSDLQDVSWSMTKRLSSEYVDELWLTRRNVDIEHPDNAAIFAERSKAKEWLASVQEFVASTMGARSSPRYIVYPMAGFDLATAVAAFDADVYVMIDDHPFLNISSENKPLPAGVRYSEDTRTGVHEVILAVNISNMAAELSSAMTMDEGRQGMLPLILGNMKVMHGDFRVRSIQYYAEAVRSWDRRYPWVHGVISFDLGEGTMPKTVIFLNKVMRPEKPHVWSGSIGEPDLSFADALLVKGSMTQFKHMPEVARYLVGLVEKNGGVIVDGQGPLGHNFSELFTDQTALPQGATVVERRDVRLSYQKGTRVLMFQEPSENTFMTAGNYKNSSGLYLFDPTASFVDGLLGGRMSLTAADLIEVGGFQMGRYPVVENRKLLRLNRTLEKLGDVVRRTGEMHLDKLRL